MTDQSTPMQQLPIDPNASLLSSMLSTSDQRVDTIHVLGVVTVLGLIVFTGWAVYQDAKSWNPLTFGTAATALITGVGGSRRIRDGLTDKPGS